MFWYVVKRLAELIFAMLVASVIVFALLRMIPGDFALTIGGINATEEGLEQIRERLGLNRPLYAQYFDWIGGVVRGDFGKSAATGSSVTSQLGRKLTITAPLAGASIVLSLLFSVPIGVYAAARSHARDGRALSAFTQLGLAVPQFLAGIWLIALLAGKFGLPSQSFPRDGWDDFGRAFRALVIPTLTLTVGMTAVFSRFVRSATLDVLHQDYIRTARAKGLGNAETLIKHGLRNAAAPVVSVLGVQIAGLIAGVVVVESVFNLPGVGRMLLDDVSRRDFDKVQGTLLLLVAVVLVVGFLVDIAHRLIDPRLRTSR